MPRRGLGEDTREITKRLKQIPARLQKRAVSAALRAGARPIVRQAKANAPKRTGALKRNIVAKAGSRKYSKPGEKRVIIGVRHGRTRTRGKLTAYDRRGQDPFYYRFQELGYRAVGRSKRRGRQKPGRQIPGRLFLTRAFESESDSAIRAITQRLAQEVEKLERRI